MAGEVKNSGAGSAKFVNAIVKDAASPPAVKLLSGHPGASHRADHRRLYLDPELRSHVDFSNDAVVHEEPMTPAESPLGGTRVWVHADAELKHGGATDVGLRAPGVSAPLCPPTSPPCIQPTPTATFVPQICHHTHYPQLCLQPTPTATLFPQICHPTHYPQVCQHPTLPDICHVPTIPCQSAFCPSVATPCVPPTFPPGTTPQFGAGGAEFLQGQMFAGAQVVPAPTHLGVGCTSFGPGCAVCEYKPWPQPATQPVLHTQVAGCTTFGPGCPAYDQRGWPNPAMQPQVYHTHQPPQCTSFGPGCPQCQPNLPGLPATRPMHGGGY